MRISKRTGVWMGRAAAAALLVCGGPARAEAAAPIQPLSVAVIKSTTGMCRSGQICHKGQAGVWIPPTDIAIVAVSIPEQTDVDLYVDIEVSTAPEGLVSRPRRAAGTPRCRRARPSPSPGRRW